MLMQQKKHTRKTRKEEASGTPETKEPVEKIQPNKTSGNKAAATQQPRIHSFDAATYTAPLENIVALYDERSVIGAGNPNSAVQ